MFTVDKDKDGKLNFEEFCEVRHFKFLKLTNF